MLAPLAAGAAPAPDGGAPPEALPDGGAAGARAVDGGAAAPARGDGGPVVELPPEAEGPAQAEPGPAAARGAPNDIAVRTSPFETLSSKASAIVNRTVLGGYGEFVFTKEEDRDSLFDARRLVVFLYAPIHPRISFTTEIEFEFGGTPKKQDGELTNGEVILEFAVLDFKVIDQLSLRAGVILVPFGKFNVNHDSPTRDLTDRPLVIRTIIPSTWFETGAGLFGKIPLSSDIDLDYEAYVINGLDSKIQDGHGNRAARGALSQDNNDDKALVGRLALTHFGKVGDKGLSVEIGASGYSGAYDRRGNRANMVGGDLTLRRGGFELLGEYVYQWNDAGFDDSWATSSRLPVPTSLRGFYVQANYHFMPDLIRHALPPDLQESVFTAVAMYEEVDTDTDRDTGGDRTRLVFGLNYRPIEAVVWKHELQLNYTLATAASGEVHRRSFFGLGDALRPSMAYVTSVAFLF